MRWHYDMRTQEFLPAATAKRSATPEIQKEFVVGEQVSAAKGFLDLNVGSRRACLYAIGPEAAYPLKIGIASYPIARLYELQAGNWTTLQVHRAIYAGDRGRASAFERSMIRQFSDRSANSRGDWFSISLEEFDAAAREIFNAKG